MALGASPLIPASVPQGSDVTAAAPRPVSDMGFLAVLSSGPAAGLAQPPIAPDSPGDAPNNGHLAMTAIISGQPMVAPAPVPEFDLPGGDAVIDPSGPGATAIPAVVISQSTPIKIDPILTGTREQLAAIDPPDPAAPVANSPPLPLRQPALGAPELTTGIPARGTLLPDGTAALSPVTSVQPAVGPPAPVETVVPRSPPVPALPNQPAFPVDSLWPASAPAAPFAIQAPKAFPDTARTVADAPIPPDRPQTPLRPDTPSPILAPPPTSPKAAAPNLAAVKPSESATLPKPSAVTATTALTATPNALPGANTAAIPVLDGPMDSAAAQIKTQVPASVWPSVPQSDSTKASSGPGAGRESLLPSTPIRQRVTVEPLLVANRARPDVPQEPLPAPRIIGQAATSDPLSVSRIIRPIVASEPLPEPTPARQGTAPEASFARRTIDRVAASGPAPATSPANPSPTAQPVPVSGPIRQGAVPELAPAALSATIPPTPQPNTPTVQQVSALPAPPPGPALAPITKIASSARAKATPTQPLLPADRLQQGTPPDPQLTRPNPAQPPPNPARDTAIDGDALSTRISDAPPLSAPPQSEVSGPPPASAPAAALARAEQVAAQITAHLATASNIANRSAPLEIALDPPELGQLRISVTHGDEGIVLNVAIDRPETLDLMRRHASLLSQEFQRQGLENTGFTFSGREGGHSALGRASPDLPGTAPPEDVPETRPVATATHIDGTGLDIRI
jgi:Flagellar hook-length control protein FliK